jgi:hypothetical protein
MLFLLLFVIVKMGEKTRMMKEYMKKVKRIQSIPLKGKKFSFIDKGINFIC